MSNTRIHARRPEAVSTMRLRPRCEQPGCDGPATYQYQYEDAYIGELNRHRSKEDILVKLVTGQMKRY
jgi:hypothetical protein